MRGAGTALFLAVALTIAPPAFGCSSHGSAAATNVNGWMNSNGVNGAGFSITGTQWQEEAGGNGSSNSNNAGSNNGNGQGNGWGNTEAGNDWYTVTITGPGNPAETVTFTANPMDFDNGADLETWLEEAAKDWLIDHMPDQQLADFVG